MEPLISNLNIIFYIIALAVTTIFYQKKKQRFDAGSVILFSYLLYAITSLILYNTPYFTPTFNSIEFFPFVYLYLMILLFVSPVLSYDQNKIHEVQKPSSIFLNTVCIIFIVASLIQIPSIIADFQHSIIKLMTESSGGQDLYTEAMDNSLSTGDGSISNLAAIISNSFGNFGVLLFFYYLTLESRNKFIVIGLSFSIIIGLFTNISLGQRGPVVEILFSMIITYYALNSFLEPKINKIIKRIGIFLLIASSVPLIALTNSRFGENLRGSVLDGSLSSIYYYVGQENLYFNNYGLDNGGIRYGDRVFPLFKSMLGYENIPNNFWERREKYPDLMINDEVFIGFVGDFTLDFGPIIAPIIFIIFILFVFAKTRIRNDTILFHQLILLHFVMCICMLGGMKLYPFSDVGGNLQLIVYFLAYNAFRIDYFNLQRKIKY